MKNKKGFTLIELIAVIAILSILALLAATNVIHNYASAKNKKMIISENEILDVAKLYIEDYCNHPINDEYECASTYKIGTSGKIYVCFNTLQKTSINEDLVQDIDFGGVTCHGVTEFDSNNKGKTYLFCDDGYITKEAEENGIKYGDYYCPDDTDYNYSITYDLDGGTVDDPNPTSYNSESAFTLYNPTKTGSTFVGWSGTGIIGLSEHVTIGPGSTGDRKYTAIWKSDTTIPEYEAKFRFSLTNVQTIKCTPKKAGGYCTITTPELDSVTGKNINGKEVISKYYVWTNASNDQCPIGRECEINSSPETFNATKQVAGSGNVVCNGNNCDVPIYDNYNGTQSVEGRMYNGSTFTVDKNGIKKSGGKYWLEIENTNECHFNLTDDLKEQPQCDGGYILADYTE